MILGFFYWPNDWVNEYQESKIKPNYFLLSATFTRCKQLSILRDWQMGPSLVQVHIVQGETLWASPVSMLIPPTEQLTRSFQWSMLMPGSASQGTRGLRKGSGMSNIERCTDVTWNEVDL